MVANHRRGSAFCPVVSRWQVVSSAALDFAGDGLDGSVPFMVVGAGYAECYTAPARYWIELVRR